MNNVVATPASIHLFDACPLRSEDTSSDNYAADLQRALRSELADPAAARQFFQSTHVTNSMAAVCRSIFRRLSQGDASAEPSIYRLGASFGGGKTHTLITLAGAAKYPQLIQDGETPVPPKLAPEQPLRLVTFTGENTDLEQGARQEETGAFRAKSLIGQIAWQLGGEYAFRQFESYDKNLASPGSEDIEHLLGEQPCLILIDETMQWLARMMRDDRYRDKLPNVTLLFSVLAKAIENRPRTVMVITSPQTGSDAYQSETQQLHHIFDEINKVVSRTAIETTPSAAADLPAILRRRLFAQVDPEIQEKVAGLYAALCQRSSALIAPPPPNQTTRQWFYDHYPFHPDTLSIITERVASNDHFQYTRGTLRLLGTALHRLNAASRDESILLLHPYHIDPDYPEIAGQLTERINKKEYIPAIEADITAADATAKRIDQTRPTQPARRLARATLLASLSPIETAQGLTEPELIRAVLTPDDADPSVVANAIVEFRKQALYIDDNPAARTVRFTTVPNLNRLLVEQVNAVTPSEVHHQIQQTIRDCFTMSGPRSRNSLDSTIFPESGAIPDNPDRVNFGVVNYEWLTADSLGLTAELTNFYRYCQLNSGANPRQHKNNLVLLVADADRNGDLERYARRWLAAEQVKNRPPGAIQPHQLENLETELQDARRSLQLAIQKLYVHLYYPSNDHPLSNDTRLRPALITAEDAVEQQGDGQHAVVKTLIKQRKLLTADSANLDPETWWRTRRNLQTGPVPLAHFREEFSREPGNYMLLNAAAFAALIGNALEQQAIYLLTGAQRVIAGRDEIANSLSDAETLLYLRDSACPTCRYHRSACQCQATPAPLCPRCGRDNHPDQDCAPQPAPSPAPTPGPIPQYHSGLKPQALNVLAQELRRHMTEHQATAADIAALALQSDRADFVNFAASLLGPHVTASVSYCLRRGADFELNIKGMTLSEWSRTLSQIAPRLEQIPEVQTRDATVSIDTAANPPDQTDSIIDRLPASHSAGLLATFKNPALEQS